MKRRLIGPHGDTWWGGVLTALVLTGGVAGCAGALSFNALRVLAISVYLPESLAPLYPLAIDGMLGVATLAAVLHRTSPLRTRAYIWALIAAAIAVSVSGNALHATGHGGDVHLPDVLAALASAVPAASLAAALHLFVIVTRSPRRTGRETVPEAVAEPVEESRGFLEAATPGEAPAESPPRSPRAAHSASRKRLTRLLKQRPEIGAAEVSRKLGVSRSTATRWLSQARRPRVIAQAGGDRPSS